MVHSFLIRKSWHTFDNMFWSWYPSNGQTEAKSRVIFFPQLLVWKCQEGVSTRNRYQPLTILFCDGELYIATHSSFTGETSTQILIKIWKHHVALGVWNVFSTFTSKHYESLKHHIYHAVGKSAINHRSQRFRSSNLTHDLSRYYIGYMEFRKCLLSQQMDSVFTVVWGKLRLLLFDLLLTLNNFPPPFSFFNPNFIFVIVGYFLLQRWLSFCISPDFLFVILISRIYAFPGSHVFRDWNTCWYIYFFVGMGKREIQGDI